MALLRYITHPNVQIDPHTPVPQWSLNDLGRRRTGLLLTQPWLPAVRQVLSSPETKALETAELIARQLGVMAEVRSLTGETDRSATGFIPHDRHELLADEFFTYPDRSASGWETATAAQARIVQALGDVLTDGDHDVAVVGHGAVGTLLMCHLAGLEIDRAYDQPGQGHYWTLDRTTDTVLHRWRPIEP